ncbi:helix-turn-helix transcriptional regulator [bacterium]|nr:helix-turn-helix transcriptional regulator [bacterium]
MANSAVDRKGAGPRVRVRELCARRKCSLRRAATEMSISPSLLSNYNSGKIGPGLLHLLTLAKFFGVSTLDDLVESPGPRGRTAGPESRIRPVYTRRVSIDRKLRPFLWDCPAGKAPAEKVVLRALTHGNFDHVVFVCRKFPLIARHVTDTYPNIRRGVRYWVDKLTKENRAA